MKKADSNDQLNLRDKETKRGRNQIKCKIECQPIIGSRRNLGGEESRKLIERMGDILFCIVYQNVSL